MKKIVWFSFFRFTDQPSRGSGTWVESMGKALVASEQYQLYNITIGFDQYNLIRSDSCGISQWILPGKTFDRRGNPPDSVVQKVCEIVEEINPDLIHHWGTEAFWGRLTAKKILKYPTLLEMQGVKWAIGRYMSGGLTFGELLKCVSIKEILRPSALIMSQTRRFLDYAEYEQEILAGHDYIDYQSDWTLANIKPYVQGKRVFKTRRMLRSVFMESTPWQYQPGNHTVFSYAASQPAKGLHVLVRAFAEVKKMYADAHLVLAWKPYSGGWLRTNGYDRWLAREIERLGIWDAVEFRGSMTAEQIVDQLHHSAIMVHPSLNESYSITLAEGMAVGAPIVTSYAGAMPEVGGDAVLYFPILDSGACADMIRKVFESRELAESLSAKARSKSLKQHRLEDVVKRQVEIYQEIIGK